MSRTLKLAALAIGLAFTSQAHAKPPKLAHLASLTEAQAEQVAQNRQDQECGRGAQYVCIDKTFPEQQCLQGDGHWYCNGSVRQAKMYVFWWTYRTCGIYIWVAQGVATLKNNTCF